MFKFVMFIIIGLIIQYSALKYISTSMQDIPDYSLVITCILCSTQCLYLNFIFSIADYQDPVNGSEELSILDSNLMIWFAVFVSLFIAITITARAGEMSELNKKIDTLNTLGNLMYLCGYSMILWTIWSAIMWFGYWKYPPKTQS